MEYNKAVYEGLAAHVKNPLPPERADLPLSEEELAMLEKLAPKMVKSIIDGYKEQP